MLLALLFLASESNLNRNVAERSLYMLTDLLPTLQISFHFNNILNIDPLKTLCIFFFSLRRWSMGRGWGGGARQIQEQVTKTDKMAASIHM